MGRFSYVLVGTEQAMKETFGSTCHGAGRLQSRSAAKRNISGREVLEALDAKGITVRAGSLSGLAEEASESYKDVNDVVGVVQGAGISNKVARTRPIAVIKG
jgi:tRNA-splicing ligase RtcB